ncbi:MAG: hypothetical protein [Microviridae sp.]|nr:MAG: hypothetical protein [Microviridae sp.]
MPTQTKSKLKIIPGRGLTGKDIKNRLRNRTLEGQTFGPEAYAIDENMNAFMKMSTVERLEAAKANASEIRRIQNNLDEANNKQKQKMQEQEIERKVQERMKEIGKEQIQIQS